MTNIIISNPEEFKKKKEVFVEAGFDKLHIISDFDRTLTKAFVDGKKFTSITSQLYNGNYLSDNYTAGAQTLHDKYHPIEIDPSVSFEDKLIAMESWWREHYELMIKSGLKMKDIEDIVEKFSPGFREGVFEFLDLLKEVKVPLVIFSSSGIGEAIPMSFEKIGKLSKNISIISNSFNFDENGVAISIKEPMIHVFNKGEVALKGLPVFESVVDRKNVLLLGDSLGDLGMIEGFNYDDLITVGFYNYEAEESLENYKKKFDVVITGDGDFEFVNSFLEEFR